MTLGTLIENIHTAYTQVGVESDSQVRIKLPDGQLFDTTDCEIVKRATPGGRWYEIVIKAKLGV